jgi:AraC-like DNA-binding protein
VTAKKKPAAMQRAAALVPLSTLLAEFGFSMDEVLAGTGVSPGQVRPEVFIPYAAFLSILDNAGTLTGRDDIGIMLGKRQTLDALGPLGAVMRHAATLGEAIAEFAEFQRNNSTGGAVYLMRADRDVILGYGVHDPTARVSPQIYGLVLAVGCNLVAELTQGAAAPEEILFSMAAPNDPTPYHRLGPCPILFGQNQTGLVLSATTLALALPEANRGLHDQALARLMRPQGISPLETSARVRHLLRPLLLVGQARMEEVAARMGLHHRTLRRRLLQEGTTFEAIKDEVRYSTARELLVLGDLSIADIAATLDYAAASAFVHAFRRWSGTSPGLWRTHSGLKAPLRGTQSHTQA